MSGLCYSTKSENVSQQEADVETHRLAGELQIS